MKDVSVFGIPDEKFGEQIVAWIQVADGDEFPMTVTGKIRKIVMRDLMTAELGGA